jgi:hypothetical protein
MGLTQHKHGVPTIREIVNFLLLRGNIGRPGARVCPVRGHSNVQDDRTMGVWERMPQAFLDSLGREFGLTPPARHGLDAVNGIRAMHEGRAKVFLGVAGNFVRATPDSAVTEEAMRGLTAPLVEAARTVPVGLVVTAREPGSVVARALTEIARHTDVAAALERLPETPDRADTGPRRTPAGPSAVPYLPRR